MIPRVGSEVDAYCTKCKMDLMHRVVAVLEARPKRAECLTCHSQHNYRKPKGAAPAPRAAGKPARAAKASTPGTKRLGKAAADLLSQWDARIAGKGKGDFTRYSVKQKFRLDQLLDHATFGQGYVVSVLEDKKINVAFRDGEKVLAHARG
jgi:hypothetical protein